MKKSLAILLAAAFVLQTTGCWRMKHEFNGVAYFNPVTQKSDDFLGGFDREKRVGYAAFGLAPYNDAPTLEAVQLYGREAIVREIKTEFTAMDIAINIVIQFFTFGLSAWVYQPRTVEVKGDYIKPKAGPAAVGDIP